MLNAMSEGVIKKRPGVAAGPNLAWGAARFFRGIGCVRAAASGRVGKAQPQSTTVWTLSVRQAV